MSIGNTAGPTVSRSGDEVARLKRPCLSIVRTAARAVAAIGVAGLSACDLLGPTVCTSEGYYAIAVRVEAASTGEVLSPAATVIARSGVYADSVTGHPGSVDLFAAFERSGVYDVSVRVDGYRNWQQTGVRARRTGECDKLRTVRLTATLQQN
ncbi:MAG TPA: hypothetical protein VFZ21_25600 [Gemmatimonadaceae bacterium]|jgi:hypothetical protein|nr:hypothetical protein [Gemmatimonadaceae bacterium]